MEKDYNEMKEEGKEKEGEEGEEKGNYLWVLVVSPSISLSPSLVFLSLSLSPYLSLYIYIDG